MKRAMTIGKTVSTINTNETEKLTGKDKHDIQKIIREAPVEYTDENIKKLILSRVWKNSLPAKSLVRSAVRYALKVHHENQRLYRQEENL